MSYIKTVRENVSAYNLLGFDSAELQDLLAVLIGNSATPELTGKLAAKGIVALGKMSVEEFINEGLTKLKALELHSAFTLAKKYMKVEKSELHYAIKSPEDAANYMMEEISYSDQEHFAAVFLNVKNEVIGKRILFIGSLNASIVHPRELFREAIKLSAASAIVYHNHPSGHLLTIV